MTKGMCECADHPSLWVLQRFYMALPNPYRGGGWHRGSLSLLLFKATKTTKSLLTNIDDYGRSDTGFKKINIQLG